MCAHTIQPTQTLEQLLDSDLHRIIQSKQALSEAHFRFFMHQASALIPPPPSYPS